MSVQGLEPLSLWCQPLWTVENKVHSVAVYLGLGLLALMTDVLGKGQPRE